jgi:Ca2+-transporting ATPase
MTGNFHTQPIECCMEALGSRLDGLHADEAAKRLSKHGKNCLPEARIPFVGLIFLRQFMSPLIYILLVAGVVTLYLQEYSGAVFIFAVLLINALIGTMQEYSASHEAAALKKMVTSIARVRRDGAALEINAEELVSGDIVLLESGNKVPADMRLIETNTLKIDESLLTGESKEVRKDAIANVDAHAATGDQVTMAFAGSMVTHGRGLGLVCATGLHTKMGEIAQHITGRDKVKSPLIQRMERFTRQISIMVGVVIVVIAGILYAQGHAPDYIFMLAVGIAVAAIPEGLPVTLTIALAIGMSRMAKRNVIVRKLVAVESLGSCTLIASDKTGTLTRNELTTERILLPSGEHFTVSRGESPVDGCISRRAEA